MNLYQIPFSKLPLFLLFTISIFLISCEEDTGSMQTEEVDYGYTAIINTPIDDATYTLGDTMFISVEYISTTKEIVHNVSVDIYSKSDNSINLYSVNTHKHVPEKYTYEDFFILNDVL